jgi:pyrimidine operon attenuation protein/uracil phosphoribosyltransferase
MESAVDVDQTIKTMAQQISAFKFENPLLVGIHTGGVWIADRLQRILTFQDHPGTLDISFYRDDFSRVGLNPEVRSSELPMEIDDVNIVLVDDVLYTGRTIRAAMNEIFSYGRPKSIKLCVLVERSGRELPVQADVVGSTLELKSNQQAKLTNTDGNLAVNIITTGKTE